MSNSSKILYLMWKLKNNQGFQEKCHIKYNYMWNPGLHIMRKLKVPHDFIFEMELSV